MCVIILFLIFLNLVNIFVFNIKLVKSVNIGKVNSNLVLLLNNFVILRKL